MTTQIIKNLTMLILNMAWNLMLYVIQENHKYDCPNSPPIHAFTQNLLANKFFLKLKQTF
jgi:hypothetical protein